LEGDFAGGILVGDRFVMMREGILSAEHLVGNRCASGHLAGDGACYFRDGFGRPGGLAGRRAAERRGREAEQAVAAYFEKRGFLVLGRRLRTMRGEIDVVVADERSLVFVEVKARGDARRAAETLPAWKQARLLDAADGLLAVHADWEREMTRFDVALVCHGRIEVIEDAIRYQ